MPPPSQTLFDPALSMPGELRSNSVVLTASTTECPAPQSSSNLPHSDTLNPSLEVKAAVEGKFPAIANENKSITNIAEPVNSHTYPADTLDYDGPLASNKSGTWETIPFESPFELICAFDPAINTGDRVLYPWQIEVTEFLAKVKPTSKLPLRYALCAANGSGKDAYVIAPFVIWFALTKIRSLSVVTSSSGTQLTAQTENYIATLARSVNALFGEPIFKITKRFIKCLKSGSEIRLFATDEAGKAEGYHPFSDHKDSEMAIIVNEAKSVMPEIFEALSRCTGYNYWLLVSSPGEPIGEFYDSFNRWDNKRRVTAFDCPGHISENHIQEVREKYGESSAIYRSQVLALFTTVGGQVVISQDHLNKCIERSRLGLTRPVRFGKIKIGLDSAAGRDEFACTAVWGNEIYKTLYFIEADTVKAENRVASWLDEMISTHGVDNLEINGDDGGVGHAILDHLVNRGYKINRVLNQSRAIDHVQYANRGTELWYNVRRIIEECLFYLPLEYTKSNDDKKLYDQLSLRHFKDSTVSLRLTLRSKKEEKAEGIDSPDRADSLALALAFTQFRDIKEEVEPKKKVEMIGKSIEELMSANYATMRGMIIDEKKVTECVRGNSLEHLMKLRAESNRYN